jgi:HAE1 family hydrophobic/amphiphilic exporter-1
MFSSFGMALGLAVLFVYMILASQFGSFVHPFTIMLALPFSIVGALLSLFVLRFSFDMLAMIGIILLMGLVTKNSILLVDFINQLRRRGVAVRDAILEAGPIRLRPILMTTLAMIFGMIPAAVGIGAGSELRQPMGIAVIGGLITSTLLTLVVVPVAYSLITDLGRLLRRSAKVGTQEVNGIQVERVTEEAR